MHPLRDGSFDACVLGNRYVLIQPPDPVKKPSGAGDHVGVDCVDGLFRVVELRLEALLVLAQLVELAAEILDCLEDVGGAVYVGASTT